MKFQWRAALRCSTPTKSSQHNRHHGKTDSHSSITTSQSLGHRKLSHRVLPRGANSGDIVVALDLWKTDLAFVEPTKANPTCKVEAAWPLRVKAAEMAAHFEPTPQHQKQITNSSRNYKANDSIARICGMSK